MTYALVRDGQIEQTGGLPRTWFDGTRWWDFRDPTVDAAALGWLEVVDTTRPADTATDTFDRTLELVGGVPTVVWQQRPWTAEEVAARQQNQNRIDIEAAIDAAIVELDNLIAAPALSTVAAGTLTTAQLSTALRTLRNEAQATRQGAQTVALRLKQTIKLVRGDYDTIT